MYWDMLSFESLKAYPWWWVSICAGVVLAALLVLIARPLQWALSFSLVLVFLFLMGGLLVWLWA